jgi:hypothetical protein
MCLGNPFRFLDHVSRWFSPWRRRTRCATPQPDRASNASLIQVTMWPPGNVDPYPPLIAPDPRLLLPGLPHFAVTSHGLNPANLLDRLFPRGWFGTTPLPHMQQKAADNSSRETRIHVRGPAVPGITEPSKRSLQFGRRLPCEWSAHD